MYYSTYTKRKTSAAYNVIDCKGMRLGLSPALITNQTVLCLNNPTILYKFRQGVLFPLKPDAVNENVNLDSLNITNKESIRLYAEMPLKIDCGDYKTSRSTRQLWFFDDDAFGDDWDDGDDWFNFWDDLDDGWDDDDDFFSWVLGNVDDWNDDDWYKADDDLSFFQSMFDDDNVDFDQALFENPFSWLPWQMDQEEYFQQLSLEVGLGVVSKMALGPQFSLVQGVLKSAVAPIVDGAIRHVCESCGPVLDVANNVLQLTVRKLYFSH